jgi:hypothetical protein
MQSAVALAGAVQSLGPLQQPAAAVEVKPQLFFVQFATWQEFPVGHVLAVEQQRPVVDRVVNTHACAKPAHVTLWHALSVPQSPELWQPLPLLQVSSK